MRGGWVYILTNQPNGTLYVGVTSNLVQRIWQHREGVVAGFTKQYGLKCLVYFEAFDDIRLAIQREKNMKHWSPRGRSGSYSLIIRNGSICMKRWFEARGWPGQARP